MKIRLFGDSIRLRLTQEEVATLSKGGALESVIPFPGEALACVVQPFDGPLEARHAASRISVLVPQAETARWAVSEEVGMYATSLSGSGGPVRIIVEKDYNCIHKPDSPDNAGTFPNPIGA